MLNLPLTQPSVNVRKWLKGASAALVAMLLLSQAQLAAETRYFLAGPIPLPEMANPIIADDDLPPVPNRDDWGTFVVPISDPDQIAHARQLIEDPLNTSNKLFVASIRYEDGLPPVNRNYYAAGAPAWSWEIDEFEDFAEIIVEAYDGIPQFVEDELEYWIGNLGHIGFWSFTIVGELPIQPEPVEDNTERSVPSPWKYSSWFGYYTDEHYPWVYHETMEWVYIFGFDPSDIWMYSPESGLMWTSESTYPDLYFSEGAN